MVTNSFKTINGKDYYFDEKGAMKTGWISQTNEYDGTAYTTWFYADASGALVTNSWIFDGGRWYYFDDIDGSMVFDGVHYVNGKLYYFNSTGAMQTGWISISGKNEYNSKTYTIWYYADASGVLKTNSWFLYGGNWYYFDSTGEMAVGYQYIGGQNYLFNANGILSRGGWVYDRDIEQWYYADKNGIALTNKWILDGNKWYFVNFNGTMYGPKCS